MARSQCDWSYQTNIEYDLKKAYTYEICLREFLSSLLLSAFFFLELEGTGKTTLLEQIFPRKKTIWFDLLEVDLFNRLQQNPNLLESEIAARGARTKTWIVIDEIQKIPPLLDEVHRLIEKKKYRFALTGSSSRKLKRGAANMLAGRALQKFLFPITHIEMGKSFDLDFALSFGSLPMVFSASNSEIASYLRAYTQTYLNEEIISEQIVRKVVPFKAFLPIAAQTSGQIVNFRKIAEDIGNDSVTVKSYFQILEDTLIGFWLHPFHESIRKRQRTAPKFYLFDIGVQRALLNQLNLPLASSTYHYGQLFEQFIISEIVRLNQYWEKDWTLSYLRTKDDAEIDLIIDRPGKPRLAIEIKSTEIVQAGHLKNLMNLGIDLKKTECYLFSKDKRPQNIQHIKCRYFLDGFREILR